MAKVQLKATINARAGVEVKQVVPSDIFTIDNRVNDEKRMRKLHRWLNLRGFEFIYIKRYREQDGSIKKIERIIKRRK